MAALICGSYAYDRILVFPGRFREHILADKTHMLNVCFLTPEMRREFGGAAGNIAYNLRLLGGDGVPMATVGDDFAPYAAWLEQCGIDARHIRVVASRHTAQAFITTDLDDNQITAFHPGAMEESHLNRVADAQGIALGILSPDGREGMLQHADQFAAAGIPFLFDPGQGLPMFDGAELCRLIDQAAWIAVNDYEMALLCERAGLTQAQIAARVEALIVTRGADGATIDAGGAQRPIPPAAISAAADPTGCGDAFRAGLLYGLMEGLDWPTTGRIAALMGAIKIESHGGQNHRFTRAEFAARLRASYGVECAALLPECVETPANNRDKPR